MTAGEIVFQAVKTRVLVLAPTARDAELTQRLLEPAGVVATALFSMPELCQHLQAGAGALLLTEDALTPGGVAALHEALVQQPPWSDLPVLILTRGGLDSQLTMPALERLGNITLLDRPVRSAILLSAVRTALRARQRQYQLQDHLAEQEQARDALKEADRRKDEFLAMLAHELRTPLASIVTAAAVLAKVSDSPAVQRQQSVIERQSRHTAHLLDDLLDVSRITQGRIDLRLRTMDLGAALEAAAGSCRASFEQRGHTFLVAPPREPLLVEGDPVRLEQVFLNLLTNAAKYTPPGGRITVAAEREDGEAVIRIQDNGVGISPDLLPRVFDLFTQAERSLARSEGGVGIGLTMVKRLVQMHSGTVEAHSAGPDQGSLFEVRLPLSPACSDALSPTAVPGSADRTGRRRVVLVDDNPDAAETLRELLELWGHETHVAHSGEEGVALLDTMPADLVLLDIGLPDIDGYEVAQRLRARGLLRSARLIAITGYGQAEDRRRSKEAGFDHHLTKPVNPQELDRLLREA